LAGKPPYATDEPDSFYETPAPQRRVRPPPPPNPNDRTSAYNLYDDYLPSGGGTANPSNRQSGVGALGMGLMNMQDSDDDSDDEGAYKPNRGAPASKNAALAAATGVIPRPPPNSPPQPPTIVAPRPGYAAPIAALNLAHSESTSVRAPPPPQPIEVPTLENPFEPPMAQVYHSNGATMHPPPSPGLPPSTPHPLQPSITPITPVFARPTKPGGITFTEPIPRTKPIMRGNTEGTILPGRGEKGDDFWRRFSMVAKIENKRPAGSKDSWWLKKTQGGTTRLSRWVWVIAVVLILAIAGISVIAWRASQSKPAHQAPTAIGGSANERPVTESVATGGVTATGSGSIKHVSPTHTVARR
ncbi:hypothetical protein P691DRAFT_621975, partial [Macrolepiota fuliginosa MF-IS2]